LNDRIADGRDISWIWDADFELLADRARRITCSGTRAEELALRLKYAGVHAELAVDRDLGRSLDAAVAAGDGGPLYALPTYTALLELRDLLARRGLARRWSE
jgi:UDP-N-acetylmuramyl tripeptide synthase